MFNEIRKSFKEGVWKALEVLLCFYRKAPIEKIKDAEKDGINFLILTEHKFFDILNLKDFSCHTIKRCLVKAVRLSTFLGCASVSQVSRIFSSICIKVVCSIALIIQQ